ncbi:MAG: GNAT family N-acetyltransferase [Thermodesulfobacteriota bacterium]
MNLRWQFENEGIDWATVASILKTVGMASYDGPTHRTAFENSRVQAFVFDEGQLIGFGRAISDVVCQAAIYDVAVRPEYQGQGIGRTIVAEIMARLPNCNFILYASPGKEGFYLRLGFRKMKTGMAWFKKAEDYAARGLVE